MKYIYVILLASLMIVSCKRAEKAGVMGDSQTSIDSMKQASIDSMKMEMEKQKVIDSMKTEMAKQEAANKEVTVINNTAPQATTTEKKKWSSTATGAVIGAGVGAATGAIISKKKGEGAIIGGLAGAGVGAGTGAIIDSKKE